MRVVVQRVTEAEVIIDGKTSGKTGKGLCVFFGVRNGDSEKEMEWLANKIAQLRIFSDEEGKMNRSVSDISGEVMVISQFTLYASTKKGNRPSFIAAEKPERAERLYDRFIEILQAKISTPLQTGIFGADMKIKLENDGPVTIVIDTDLKW